MSAQRAFRLSAAVAGAFEGIVGLRSHQYLARSRANAQEREVGSQCLDIGRFEHTF